MTTKNIKIRKATEKDYPAVNTLYYETYNSYHKNIPDSYKKTPKKALPKGTFLNMIEHKESFVIVAKKNEVVVGMLYATIEKNEGDEWSHSYHRVSIEEISVLPAFISQGIGTMLLQETENWTKKKKINDLIVLVYAFNKIAISFYEKNSYNPYSIQMKKKI